MGFCKSDQKIIPVVGFLTCNDCDVLRAKTGLYRRVTHRNIIPPTTGTCGALTYLQGGTQGGLGPAECLSRSVIIMYKSKYIHKGLYLSRSEEKTAFSSYSSPALYNRWVTWRKELNKKAVTHY